MCMSVKYLSCINKCFYYYYYSPNTVAAPATDKVNQSLRAEQEQYIPTFLMWANQMSSTEQWKFNLFTRESYDEYILYLIFVGFMKFWSMFSLQDAWIARQRHAMTVQIITNICISHLKGVKCRKCHPFYCGTSYFNKNKWHYSSVSVHVITTAVLIWNTVNQQTLRVFN